MLPKLECIAYWNALLRVHQQERLVAEQIRSAIHSVIPNCTHPARMVLLLAAPALTCALCCPALCFLWLQLKDLLAPYGQLKSLSVAMDAATGKNKVWACCSLGSLPCSHVQQLLPSSVSCCCMSIYLMLHGFAFTSSGMHAAGIWQNLRINLCHV